STSLPDLREIDLDLTPSSSARDRVRSGQGLVGATSLFPPGFRPNRRSPPVVYSCRRRPPALSACPLRASALKLGRRCASAPPVAAARFHDSKYDGVSFHLISTTTLEAPIPAADWGLPTVSCSRPDPSSLS
uniref:Uncharacterized protein n=1 Tax=Aegilops tauschii subsp. strangulata TaxID=200361 RepID=A0A453I3I3_AEGTS